MMNYSYFWSIDGEIRLPRPERTYFDDLSEEYKDASTDKKLLEIAYCIWHGLSLYDEVKTMLQEHTQVKEHTIKSCLLGYIEYLRSGDTKNNSYIILKDKLTLKQTSDLLSEELMLRYRLPANGIESHYLTTAHWNYNETQNNDYFKPTKVSAVPLTKQEIRDTNPWQSSYVHPNPSALYAPDAEWLLTCDEQIVKEFNRKTNDPEYNFMLGMRPEIFNGNPLKSKVVILSLNPGYVYRVNNLYARLLQMVQPIEEAVKLQKDNQLKLSASSFFCQRNHNNSGGMISYRDAHCAIDDWYWYDIFKDFRKEAGLPEENDENDVIFNNVSVVQYVGYLSKSWKSLPKFLPSQRFTRMLIHYLSLYTDTLFVVSRSEELWKRRLIGDEIWEMLDNDKRLVHRKKFENKKGITQTIRTQGFTKASFEDGGFDRIADKFRT